MTFQNPKPRDASLLAEYQAAHDYALHSNNLAWQIGSILISGVLILFGFLADKNTSPLFFFGGILIANIIISIWLCLFEGEHQIMLIKLYRIREIEKELGLKQNLLWEEKRNGSHHGIYRTFGPSGTVLTKYLYISISVITISFGLIKYIPIFSGNNNFLRIYPLVTLILSFLIFSFTFAISCCNRAKFNIYLKTNPDRK